MIAVVGHVSRKYEVTKESSPPKNIPNPLTKTYEYPQVVVIFFRNIQPIQVTTTESNNEICARFTHSEDSIPAVGVVDALLIIIGREARKPMISPNHFLGVMSSVKKKKAKSAVIKGERLYIKAT